MNEQSNEHGLVDFLLRCPCALCGAKATIHFKFTPDMFEQYSYGAPSGKTRHIFYGVCAKCLSRGPAIFAEVERAALADLGRPIWN